MRFRARRVVISVALALVADACGADGAFGPGSRADLTQVINELEIAKANFAMSWSRPIRPTIPTVIPANCPYSASSQTFACPSQTLSGVAVTQSFSLFNASGAKQDAFDVARTDAVRMTTTLAGRYSLNGSDLAVAGQESLTLSGLLSGKHTVDGTSTLHLDGIRSSLDALAGGFTQTPIVTTITTTVASLVLPPTLTVVGAPAVPVSGTITVVNSSSISGQPAILSSAVFPYDGTSTVVAVITVAGITHTCPVQLVGISYSVCL